MKTMRSGQIVFAGILQRGDGGQYVNTCGMNRLHGIQPQLPVSVPTLSGAIAC